jgi:subtilisin family serine protease
MRRLSTLLFVTLFATTTFAATKNETDPQLNRDFDRARHMILSPAAPLTEQDRADLLAEGVEIQRPLTGGRYIARVAPAARVAEDARITSVEPMTAAHKIYGSARRAGDVTVIFHQDVALDDARKSVLAAGGTLDDFFTSNYGPTHIVDARIAPASLNALAADENVLAIAGRIRSHLVEDNAIAAQLSHVPEVYAAPYNLSGAGQIVMVSELSDAQASHPEFGGRLTAGGSAANGQHSTHVSGTIGASGVNPSAKGMAPNVQIREFNVGSSISSHLKALNTNLAATHIVANNTSLGFPLGWCDQCDSQLPLWLDSDLYYGAYDPGATLVYDDITKTYGTLLVFSAGNDGQFPQFQSGWREHYHADDNGDADTTKEFCVSLNGSGTDCPATPCNAGCELVMHHNQTPWDTMTITGAAKNVLAVGALRTNTTPPSIASFSSRGPAKDGRVKPDISARGQSLLSTWPTSTYSTLSGTSMAAPVVTGISALLGEQWQKTFNAPPTVAELRGVILAGATDLGNTGPDYTFGFGLIDAKASADLIIGDGGTRSQIVNVNISQGTRVERAVTVTSAQKLKVLVTWADPSVVLLGNDSFEAKALVNDLDVQVIGPNGTVYLPYVLDKVHYENPATTGVNTIDNTELVEIANAAPGVYRVIVIGSKVNQGPQTAVVITNLKSAGVTPCSDVQEPNNSAETAWGNVPPGTLTGAICTAGDVDFFKFQVTLPGPIRATIQAGDTPLKATMTGTGAGGVGSATATINIPPGQTLTNSFLQVTGVSNVILKIEATGPIGANPTYKLTLEYGQFAGTKHRASRH